MSIKTVSSSNSALLNVEDVRGRLADKTVEVITRIADANKTNLASNDPNKLQKGIYYDFEYMEALKKLDTPNAQKLFNWLREKGSFFHGHVPQNAFIIRPATQPAHITEKTPNAFLIKNNVTPSEAMDRFEEGLTLPECAIVCSFAQVRAIQSILGNEKFNFLFNSSTPTPLSFGYLNQFPILKFLDKNDGKIPVKKGGFIYVENVPTYGKKHLNGAGKGFNFICVDDSPGSERFASLGTPGNGLTYQEIDQLLLDEYNCPPVEINFMPEKLKEQFINNLGIFPRMISANLQDHQLSMQEFKEQGGGRITHRFAFNAERITQIANASFSQARNILDAK